LRDADLKLIVVHQQLIFELTGVLEELTPVSVWIVKGDGEQSFENRYAALSKSALAPQLNLMTMH
jgi:hypothetical protein